MHKRAELLAHVHHTTSPYNLPEIGKKIAYTANREGGAERFADPAVQKTIEVDLALMTYDDQLLQDLELSILQTAKQHDANTLYLLPTVPALATSSASCCSTTSTAWHAFHGCRSSPRIAV
jgi:hypothetical protein